MNDYQLGSHAYILGHAFDPTRSLEWQRGWSDAEDDDLYGSDYDAYDDFGDY